MLTGSIHFHHFILLLEALILAVDHKVIGNQTCCFHFLAHLSTGRDDICFGVEVVKLNILMLGWNEVLLLKGSPFLGHLCWLTNCKASVTNKRNNAALQIM